MNEHEAGTAMKGQRWLAIVYATTLLACRPTASPARSPTIDVSRNGGRDGNDGSSAKDRERATLLRSEVSSLENLRATSRVVDLPVEGFFPAVLHIPPTDRPRPLVIGAHGADDRADAFCDVLAAAVQGRAFVLCPRGKRTDARTEHAEASYFFPTHLWLEREIAAGIDALSKAYSERVDTTRALYAGFSQGAIMGALVVPRNPTQFPRALLIEGSYGLGLWSIETGARFRRLGGERIAFVCGGWFCAEQARASAFTIDGRGTRSKVVRATGGHTYGGDVARSLASVFSWVVEGDPRFAGP